MGETGHLPGFDHQFAEEQQQRQSEQRRIKQDLVENLGWQTVIVGKMNKPGQIAKQRKQKSQTTKNEGDRIAGQQHQQCGNQQQVRRMALPEWQKCLKGRLDHANCSPDDCCLVD